MNLIFDWLFRWELYSRVYKNNAIPFTPLLKRRMCKTICCCFGFVSSCDSVLGSRRTHDLPPAALRDGAPIHVGVPRRWPGWPGLVWPEWLALLIAFFGSFRRRRSWLFGCHNLLGKLFRFCSLIFIISFDVPHQKVASNCAPVQQTIECHIC